MTRAPSERAWGGGRGAHRATRSWQSALPPTECTPRPPARRNCSCKGGTTQRFRARHGGDPRGRGSGRLHARERDAADRAGVLAAGLLAEIRGRRWHDLRSARGAGPVRPERRRDRPLARAGAADGRDAGEQPSRRGGDARRWPHGCDRVGRCTRCAFSPGSSTIVQVSGVIVYYWELATVPNDTAAFFPMAPASRSSPTT